MKFKELLNSIQETATEINASKPYLCGGLPRDRYMNKLDQISDIDITTGDESIFKLSSAFYQKMQSKFNVTRKIMDDNHSSIFFENIKVDFSSNFNSPEIIEALKKKNILNPTSLQKEVFSRDYNCNSLLLDFDLKSIKDVTGKGLSDIDNKIINTCLEPQYTLDYKRVIRSVYLACKLDFEIHQDVIDYVLTGNVLLLGFENLSHFTDSKLTKAFQFNPEKASSYLTKMNFWDKLQSIPKIANFYYLKFKNNKVAYFQGGGGVNEPTPHKKKYKSDPKVLDNARFDEPFYRNYDLYNAPGIDPNKPAKHSPGVGYHSLMKEKSVKEFLNKHKKKYKGSHQVKMDDGSVKNVSANLLLLNEILKKSEWISYDNPVGYNEFESSYSDSVPNAGLYTPNFNFEDFEQKQVDNLNYGRDYVDDEGGESLNKKNVEDLLGLVGIDSTEKIPDGLMEEENFEDLATPNKYHNISNEIEVDEYKNLLI